MVMKLYALNFSYVQVPRECEREYALACFMCPLSDRKNKTEQGINGHLESFLLLSHHREVSCL